MLALLASLAFATPLANCNVKDYPDQVAGVFYEAEHPGRDQKMADGTVYMAEDPMPVPGNYYYLIQTHNAEHLTTVGLVSWHPIPGPPAGMIAPSVVQMTREGDLIDAPKGQTCKGARTLVLEFFAHIPK